MAATLNELIMKGCACYYEGALTSQFKTKIQMIVGHFSTLSGFKSATIDDINALKSIEGEKCFKALTEKEAQAIQLFQEDIDLENTLIQNFIKILTKRFINKQLEMLSTISLESFNTNPILCAALNLKTPEEFIKYNAYQFIGRSIVTSMGYLVQDLLLYSSDSVYEGKNYDEGDKTKWDLVIDRLGEVRSYLEIKSGFNDMDAGQVKHYADEIKLVEEKGYKGFIGITYGKKNSRTVTSGLLETYVKDWEKKTLVGRELWDYVSNNESFHITLIETIDSVANTILQNVSIVRKIEDKIAELETEFHCKYETLDSYYDTLW